MKSFIENNYKLVLSIQLILFYIILILPINNIIQTLLLLSLWFFTFKKLTKVEWFLIIFVNCVFTFNNHMAIANGTFRFLYPSGEIIPALLKIEYVDSSIYLLGLPLFELFMWGYYLTHTLHFWNPQMAKPNFKLAIPLTVLFAASFSIFPQQERILMATSFSFFVLLMFYHTKDDLKCALHMIFIGTILEHLGVKFSLWSYNGDYAWGVAYWYVNLFGGTGILLSRLGLPLMDMVKKKIDNQSSLTQRDNE